MLQIVGEDSLLGEAIKQINGFVPPKNIWIVTIENKGQGIRFHLDSLGALSEEIQSISEPMGRNTTPVIGLAAIYRNHLFPESLMIGMPSDHAISDAKKFLSDIKLAIYGAKKDSLIEPQTL